ncbi:hypothetical protein GCM10029964_109490 [Kibdelosporangium lantanae]
MTKRPPTAQEFVLDELRRLILTGEMAAGAPIRQDALAERFGVSRVPLREALRTLEGEGQVTYRPHHGYQVANLSMADLLEVYRIRELLETEATRLAVPGSPPPTSTGSTRPSRTSRRPRSPVTSWA